MNLTLPNLDVPIRIIHFELPPLLELADLKSLARLRRTLDARINGESSSVPIDRLDALRERIRTMPFKEATKVPNRESLLLTLYLLDQGKGYMRPFDARMCDELFGDGAVLLRSRSRLAQAANLFFAHFDRLPGHPELALVLRKALLSFDPKRMHHAQISRWREHIQLFTIDGPQSLVAKVRNQDTLLTVAQQCGVPSPSQFFEIAQRHYLLAGLRNIVFGSDSPLFDELIAQRETILTDGQALGAAALRILVDRSIRENSGRLPDRWGMRVAVIGCDPRLPRRSKEFNRWWSWAANTELDVAKGWFTGTDLKEFLAILKGSLGTNAERMFERREQFLLERHRAGKIRDARLVLIDDAMRDAQTRFKDQLPSSFARMRRNVNGISVICLRFDDFYMVEGTHIFSLRLFKKFPIADFWERSESLFSLRNFQDKSDKAIPHQGDWEQKFANALIEAPFHLTWNAVQEL